MPELTASEIAELLASKGQRRGGGKKDPTEPRVIDNWWHQDHHFINRDDSKLECMNVNCQDPRKNDPRVRVFILAMVKERLMCRYCFLDGWLSGKEHD